MTDQLAEIETLLARAGAGWSRSDALNPDAIDWLVGEIKRLREENQAQDATITGLSQTIGYLTQALGEVER